MGKKKKKKKTNWLSSQSLRVVLTYENVEDMSGKCRLQNVKDELNHVKSMHLYIVVKMGRLQLNVNNEGD